LHTQISQKIGHLLTAEDRLTITSQIPNDFFAQITTVCLPDSLDQFFDFFGNFALQAQGNDKSAFDYIANAHQTNSFPPHAFRYPRCQVYRDQGKGFADSRDGRPLSGVRRSHCFCGVALGAIPEIDAWHVEVAQSPVQL
jgi:hypothetical protein